MRTVSITYRSFKHEIRSITKEKHQEPERHYTGFQNFANKTFASRQIIDEFWLFFSEEYECGIHMKTDVSESIELILDVSVIGRDFHNIQDILFSKRKIS